jgi:hypothetical protein
MLLGARGLEVGGDYRTAKMPAVNQGLLDGRRAWRQHDGGHTDAPNMKWFIQWAKSSSGKRRRDSKNLPASIRKCHLLTVFAGFRRAS